MNHLYEVQVYDEYVIQGNTAVLRCQIPSYVSGYVMVTSWVRSDNYIIRPQLNNIGMLVILNFVLNGPIMCTYVINVVYSLQEEDIACFLMVNSISEM